MAITVSGELLAVTARHFDANERGPAQDVYTFKLFDQDVIEARLGRDFPLQDRIELTKMVDQGHRPRVELSCFLSSGRFYANSAALIEPAKS